MHTKINFRKKIKRVDLKHFSLTNTKQSIKSMENDDFKGSTYSRSQSNKIYQSSSEHSSYSNPNLEKSNILNKIESDHQNNTNSPKQEHSNSYGQNEHSSGSFVPFSFSTPTEQTQILPNNINGSFFLGNSILNSQFCRQPSNFMRVQYNPICYPRSQNFIPFVNNLYSNNIPAMNNFQNIRNGAKMMIPQNNSSSYFVMMPVNINIMPNYQENYKN